MEKETIETVRCKECGMFVPVGSTHRCLSQSFAEEKVRKKWNQFKVWLSFQHSFFRWFYSIQRAWKAWCRSVGLMRQVH